MKGYEFIFTGVKLTLLPSGALWWPDEHLLCVSDLHLGKSERIARKGGAILPPYETRDTLLRLERDIEATGTDTIVCLGDSFDDLEASGNLPEDEALWLTRLMAGRRWVWIEGNHDPGPIEFAGTHLAELLQPPLHFRHIARVGAAGEITGHFHPKAQLHIKGRTVSRPCMLFDGDRVIMPSYGTYTGGLRSDHSVLSRLMRPEAIAVLLGSPPQPIPMPR
ncbi:ligase-associated DNA damage response endonuclease PdeM [Aliiroseovarius sp. 2305UL8-7]|uniref:ligase-associated DNA damage response endonuclease PdeM n=1 Tax=Aliiroseovarius conchicola TaxID=3121637 RepID=UPI0035289DD3